MAAAILWSTSGLFAKNPVFSDWPPETRGLLLAFWRALFAGMFLLPFARPHRYWTRGMFPMVVSFAAMNASYLTAMSLTTAANAIWLQNTAPLWVFLTSIFVLKCPPSRADLWLLGCCLSGVAMILACEWDGDQPAGVVSGLVSGVSYAGVIVSIQRLGKENRIWLVAVCHLAAAAALAPVLRYSHDWPSGEELTCLALFGLVQMAVPYVLFASALRQVTGTEASLIVLLEPLLVPVWVALAWGERPAWWTLAGGALILAGLATRYLRPSARFADDAHAAPHDRP